MARTLLNNHIYKFEKTGTYSVNDIVAYQTNDIIDGREFITVGRILGRQKDCIQFIDGEPYRNGKIFHLPRTATMNYLCISKDKYLMDSLRARYNIDHEGDTIQLNLTKDEFEQLKTVNSQILNIQKYVFDKTVPDFANKFNKNWSRDFFGPLCIPSQLSMKDTNMILISGGYSPSELLQDSVYFITTDNVQNEFDSRYKGLVSKKLIIGKLIK